MKKIKITKIVTFLVIILMVLTVNISCYATSCSEIENSAKSFKDVGQNKMTGNLSTIPGEITTSIAPIIQMLTTVGILIVGICMAVLGIQWVMARPSPEEQAKMKHKLIALAISAGVLFGSYTIWRICVTVLDSIDG